MMENTGEGQPRGEAEQVMQAVLGRMKHHRQDLNEAHHGLLKFRKQNGKIDIGLTTTK